MKKREIFNFMATRMVKPTILTIFTSPCRKAILYLWMRIGDLYYIQGSKNHCKCDGHI